MSKNNSAIKSDNIKLVLNRTFDAPRELVWQAWTDPAKMKLWFKAGDAYTNFSTKANVRVGGKYRIQLKNPDGEFFTAVGTYREIKAPERLAFTWAWEKDGSEDDFGEVEAQETLLTLEFKARDKQTELTLVQERFDSTESRDKHVHGWTGNFEQLAKFLGLCAGGGVAPVADPKSWIGKEFVIMREYAAPREMVWRACTEAKHLAQWWGPRGFSTPVCEWAAKPSNKIYVVMRAPNGTDFPMGGKFHEVVAPEKLVTTTGALDADGKMIFEFHHTLTLAEQPDGKTKLTMRSRLAQIFSPDAAKYIGGFEAGMTQSLERLTDLVESGPLTLERTFAAPAALVWRAITDRDDMAKWYFDTEKFEPKVGCEFRFVVEHEGNTYDHRCQVTEVIPQKKIAYTWRYEGHEGNSLVTFELFPEGDKTRLKLTHDGLDTFPKTALFPRKNFLQGWTSLLGTELKQFVETKNQPSTK
jgi:uncharacterized protein YndB with AHSA1/START domain